jgi:hypothetical protein
MRTLVVLVAFAAAAPARAETLEGTWKLVAAEDLRAEGRSRLRDPQEP